MIDQDSYRARLEEHWAKGWYISKRGIPTIFLKREGYWVSVFFIDGVQGRPWKYSITPQGTNAYFSQRAFASEQESKDAAWEQIVAFLKRDGLL